MERINDGRNNMKDINNKPIDYSWVHPNYQQQQHGRSHELFLHNNNNGDSSSSSSSSLAGGFSWPPRSYDCSFCRREFKSAQALGGHMNVHRRDRARLRQSPPLPPRDNQFSSLLNLNLDPMLNPNPNTNPSYYSSSSPPAPSSPSSRKFPSIIPILPFASSSCDMGKWRKIEGIPVNNNDHFFTNKAIKGYNKSGFEVEKAKASFSGGVVKNNGEIGKLELKIGLKEDLDLELRLGYTT